MAVAQIKYYLYVLHKHGLTEIKGMLTVPKEHYSEEVLLTADDIVIIEGNLRKIESILLSNDIPSPIDKPACKSCAYYEFCYI